MTAIMSYRDLAALPRSLRFYIYGTGTAGRRLRMAVERHCEQPITGFIDSFQDGWQDGVPVITPEQLLMEDGADLIVAVASQHWAEILPRLSGLRLGKVFNAYFLTLDLARPELGSAVSSLIPLRIRHLRSGVDETVTGASGHGLEEVLGRLTESATEPGETALLSGLRALTRHDLFVAVDGLYRWLRATPAGASLAPAGDGKGAVLCLGGTDALTSRFADLEALAGIALQSPSGGGLFAEAAILSLARLDSFASRYAQAQERLLTLAARPSADPRWAHLVHDTLFALDCRLREVPLPAALEHLVGDDPGYLKQRICAQPFKRFDIQPDGDVLVCCHHWLPTRIGNIYLDTPDGILNSPTVRDIRGSMLDGSFKYCRLSHCSLALTDSLDVKHRSIDPVAQWAAETGSTKVEHAHSVVVAFDQSCNLSCPSCRSGIITDKGPIRDVKVEAADTVILPLLRRARQVLINSAGEVLASKPSRHILARLNRREFPELEVDIISNGVLFGPGEWEKFPGIHDMIGYVRISVDAATQETFERLRRGGQYDRFCRNMAFLADLRRQGIIPRLAMSFTYQADNFREMPAFVEWCRRHAVDYVTFEKLENIAFPAEVYRRKAVHFPDHPDYEEFRNLLSHPLLADPIVHIDLPPDIAA